MPVTPGPPQPPAGFLWSSGWKLELYAQDLYSLGASIQGIYLIGEYLAAPFMALADLIASAGYYLRAADDILYNASARINAILDGWLFIDILYWASGHFREIRENTYNWIIGLLAAVSGYLIQVAFYPSEFVRIFWTNLVAWAAFFLYDPHNWLRAFFSVLRYEAWQLLYDPFSLVRDKIYAISQDLYQIVNDPFGWVREKLIVLLPDGALFLFDIFRWFDIRIRAFSQELSDFISNPIYYLQLKMLFILQVSSLFLSDPITALTDSLIEKFQHIWRRYKDLIERVVTDIVVDFM